jgi:hypothetical protein
MDGAELRWYLWGLLLVGSLMCAVGVVLLLLLLRWMKS